MYNAIIRRRTIKLLRINQLSCIVALSAAIISMMVTATVHNFPNVRSSPM